jgi:uncharacterized protein (TIGR01777 family)
MKKIIIAGGSGYLGKAIVKYWEGKDVQFVILSRTASPATKAVKYVPWDGKTLGEWTSELEGADALINLAGKSVNCRYTDENKKEIFDSRTMSTGVLGTAILQLKNPPKVWINAASATIYRHAEDRDMDELTGEIGEGFSVEVCKLWEKTFNEIQLPATKKFVLRIAIVLGKDDGVMTRLINLVKFGLGGKQGNGNQYFSWVHEQDFCRVIEWCITNPEQGDTYNCAAPVPVTNSVLMEAIRRQMKMLFGLPAPKWLLKIGAAMIGTETELVLKSRRVVPTQLLAKGFVFKYNTIKEALQNIIPV